MSVSDRYLPYRNVRYLVEIDGIERAGFSRCRLPTATTGVVEYREGNEPPTPRTVPGLTRYGPLRLACGVSDSTVLADWRELVERGEFAAARRSLAVQLLDASGEPGPRWEFRGAWPSRYEAPDLDALHGTVAVDTLDVTHDGFERVR